MSATRHATASIKLGCNCMPSPRLQLSGVLSGGGEAIACPPLDTQLQLSHPKCNCMSSTRLQLCTFLSEEGFVACLSLFAQLHVFHVDQTQLCFVGWRRGNLHVHHYACNCKYRPRLQLHVLNAVAALWCLVKGTGAVACLPLGMQLQGVGPDVNYVVFCREGQLHVCD